jgi:hypothetical protein
MKYIIVSIVLACFPGLAFGSEYRVDCVGETQIVSLSGFLQRTTQGGVDVVQGMLDLTGYDSTPSPQTIFVSGTYREVSPLEYIQLTAPTETFISSIMLSLNESMPSSLVMRGTYVKLECRWPTN